MNGSKCLTALVFAAVLALVACEGPVGPAGPAGSQGPKGEQGPRGEQGIPGKDGESLEGVFVSTPLPTANSYGENGVFTLVSDLITPENFLGLYVQVSWDEGGTAYIPLENMVTMYVSLAGEDDELQTPVLIVDAGQIHVLDPRGVILFMVQPDLWTGFTPDRLAILLARAATG